MLADAARLQLLEFDCSRAISATVPWIMLVELAFREASLNHAASYSATASVLAAPESQVPQLAGLVEAIGRHSELVMLELASVAPKGAIPAHDVRAPTYSCYCL